MRKIVLPTLFLLFSSIAVAAESSPLPFIHDDYGKALVQARQRKLPIFIEVSAPW